jgi:tRNA G18 (ribose-2'-O)-methylase SpoU
VAGRVLFGRVALPKFIPVTDANDPRTAAYRDVRERDLAGREGLFIAEGEVVLRVLLRQKRTSVVSLLIAEKRLPGLADLIDDLPAEVPVFGATQEAMDAIAGFHLHRGILAIGRRPAEGTVDALLSSCPPRALIVILHGIGNHDNMGGIFRNAAAFGADAVILDADCCDPLYRKAIRVSVGAALMVPYARLGRDEDNIAVVERHGFVPLALSPRGEAVLAETPRPPRAALLLGAEGPGLPAAILARARTIRIPMAAGFDSLNVATASGIALCHLAGAG